MKFALIGYTGFVGSNILKQTSFDDLYNSKNIDQIDGKEYDLLVSAGTKAERWKANLESEEDWKGIKSLLDRLKNVKVKHFILISTVDVYPDPAGCDEDSSIDIKLLKQPYGLNRFKMEEQIKKLFPKVTIIRFPQLFGPGLKKNFAFDLIHNNVLEFTHKDSHMQWYNLKNIWKDIKIAMVNSIPLINFAVEPIKAWELAKYALDMNFDNVTEKPPLRYNFLTKYGYLFRSNDKYIYHKKEILEELKNFILKERERMRK